MAQVHIDPAQKTEMLATIRRAKSAHIRWRAYAQALVSGVPVTEDQAPTVHTECRFGKWYYTEGTETFKHLPVFGDIALPHEMLHSVYQEIYESVGNGQLEQAKGQLDELMGISRTLLEQIELLEKEIEAA